MRMRRSRVQRYCLKGREIKKDSEGGTYEEYGQPVEFSGELWPASGKVQAETYGIRLPYIRNVRIDGRYIITADRDGVVHYVYPDGLDVMELDGLCLYALPEAGPDYKIISIKPYSQLRLECERI